MKRLSVLDCVYFGCTKESERFCYTMKIGMCERHIKVHECSSRVHPTISSSDSKLIEIMDSEDDGTPWKYTRRAFIRRMK